MQGIENTPVFNTCLQKIDLFFSEGKIFMTQVRLLEYITSYHHMTASQYFEFQSIWEGVFVVVIK